MLRESSSDTPHRYPSYREDPYVSTIDLTADSLQQTVTAKPIDSVRPLDLDRVQAGFDSEKARD